jgi:hypothetical protein
MRSSPAGTSQQAERLGETQPPRGLQDRRHCCCVSRGSPMNRGADAGAQSIGAD